MTENDNVTQHDDDPAAATLATWRAALPEITTAPAYAEALRLCQAIVDSVERFEQRSQIPRNWRGLL